MKKETFCKIIKDAINNWSSDTKSIEIKKEGISAVMHDGSEFKISIEQLSERSNDRPNYYVD